MTAAVTTDRPRWRIAAEQSFALAVRSVRNTARDPGAWVPPNPEFLALPSWLGGGRGGGWGDAGYWPSEPAALAASASSWLWLPPASTQKTLQLCVASTVMTVTDNGKS